MLFPPNKTRPSIKGKKGQPIRNVGLATPSHRATKAHSGPSFRSTNMGVERTTLIVSSHYSKSIFQGYSNAMSIDMRMNEILEEYKRDWDEHFIPILIRSFPQ